MSDTGFAVWPRWLKGELPPPQLVVYVALTFYTDKQDRCWPSVSSLAQDTCQHENTVRRALNALRDRGLVEWDERFDSGGDQTTNMYRVRVSKPRGFKPQKGGYQRSTPPYQRSTTPPAQKYPPPTTEVDDQEPKNKTIERAVANAPALHQNEFDARQNAASDFDRFWSMACRKVGKGAARKKFTVALQKVTVQELLAAWAVANRVWADWPDRSLIPHPATWLGQERWGDDPPEPHVDAKQQQKRTGDAQVSAVLHEAERQGMNAFDLAGAFRDNRKQQQQKEIGQ